MNISNQVTIINKKEFPLRIMGNENSEYVYLLHHGLLSKKESWIPFEKLGINKYLFISFDARGNEGSNLNPSRFVSTYINDLKDIVMWVKKNYPTKKIIVAGSSWGASVVIKFARKYNELVHKVIAWSIPHKIFGSDETINAIENTKTKKKDTSTIWQMIVAFFWMFFFNINTHIKIKINYEKTTKNKTLIRLGKLKTFNSVSTKYLWSVQKILKPSIRAIKYLNKKSKIKILYIQSTHDTYGSKKTYKYLEKNTNNNVDYLLINEFFHAFHWEQTNKLNVRIFNTLRNWINTNKLYLEKITTPATHTNKKINFSFIVAIYNVVEYLDTCITSLLDNETNDYEIILVDDNSTDGSKEIIQKYKNIHNVKIIYHKTNMGLSAVRNTGIENASGEWFIFIDSDDYISPNFTKNIVPHLDDEHNIYIYYMKKDKKARKIDAKVQKYKANDSLVSRVINNSVFHIYRFPDKYRYGVEDWDFYVHEWTNLKIKNICASKDLWYYYRYNEKSLSKSKYVYRSRLTHAIAIYSNPKTRQIAITYRIYGHYYLQLLSMAIIWFPNLIDVVKKIKYKQKNSLSIKIHYWLIKIKFIRNIARKQRKRINE